MSKSYSLFGWGLLSVLLAVGLYAFLNGIRVAEPVVVPEMVQVEDWDVQKPYFFEITNPAKKTVTVDRVGIDCACVSFRGLDVPFVIEPSESKSIEVNFSSIGNSNQISAQAVFVTASGEAFGTVFEGTISLPIPEFKFGKSRIVLDQENQDLFTIASKGGFEVEKVDVSLPFVFVEEIRKDESEAVFRFSIPRNQMPEGEFEGQATFVILKEGKRHLEKIPLGGGIPGGLEPSAAFFSGEPESKAISVRINRREASSVRFQFSPPDLARYIEVGGLLNNSIELRQSLTIESPMNGTLLIYDDESEFSVTTLPIYCVVEP